MYMDMARQHFPTPRQRKQPRAGFQKWWWWQVHGPRCWGCLCPAERDWCWNAQSCCSSHLVVGLAFGELTSLEWCTPAQVVSMSSDSLLCLWLCAPDVSSVGAQIVSQTRPAQLLLSELLYCFAIFETATTLWTQILYFTTQAVSLWDSCQIKFYFKKVKSQRNVTLSLLELLPLMHDMQCSQQRVDYNFLCV